MQRMEMLRQSTHYPNYRLWTNHNSGLTEAIEKACTMAKKAWGEKNGVTGVAQMMDSVIGSETTFHPVPDEELKAGDLSLRLDGSSEY